MIYAHNTQAVEYSSLYRELRAESDEILKHKWIESEKAGRNVGIEWALIDWFRNHREKWRKEYLEKELAERAHKNERQAN